MKNYCNTTAKLVEFHNLLMYIFLKYSVDTPKQDEVESEIDVSFLKLSEPSELSFILAFVHPNCPQHSTQHYQIGNTIFIQNLKMLIKILIVFEHEFFALPIL